jgi:hypothetical protein
VSRVEKKKIFYIELSITCGRERKKNLVVESSWWAATAVGGLGKKILIVNFNGLLLLVG